jgi:MFS family permease
MLAMLQLMGVASMAYGSWHFRPCDRTRMCIVMLCLLWLLLDAGSVCYVFSPAELMLLLLLLLLLLQGLGEGVALPSMSNMVAAHVPASAKARALGMSFTGFHTGKAVTCPVGHFLQQHHVLTTRLAIFAIGFLTVLILCSSLPA